jgi:hypothetical protein
VPPPTHLVRTRLVLLSVNAYLASRATVSHVRKLTNVRPLATVVRQRRAAPMYMDRLLAPAILGTLAAGYRASIITNVPLAPTIAMAAPRARISQGLLHAAVNPAGLETGSRVTMWMNVGSAHILVTRSRLVLIHPARFSASAALAIQGTV